MTLDCIRQTINHRALRWAQEEYVKNSSERIISTHAGSLPRPDDLVPLIMARSRGDAYDKTALDQLLPASVAEVVDMQVSCGLDSVNDGELSKTNFTNYVRERLGGFEARPAQGRRDSAEMNISARDYVGLPGVLRDARLLRPSAEHRGVTGHGRQSGGVQTASRSHGLRRATEVRRQRVRPGGHSQLQGGAGQARRHGGLPARRTRPARSSTGCATTTTTTTRSSSSPSPTPCTKSTRRSRTPASSCRSTTRTCRTAGRCSRR